MTFYTIYFTVSDKTPFEEFRVESVNRRGRKIVAEIKITPITIDGRVTTLILLIDERHSELENKPQNSD